MPCLLWAKPDTQISLCFHCYPFICLFFICNLVFKNRSSSIVLLISLAISRLLFFSSVLLPSPLFLYSLVSSSFLRFPFPLLNLFDIIDPRASPAPGTRQRRPPPQSVASHYIQATSTCSSHQRSLYTVSLDILIQVSSACMLHVAKETREHASFNSGQYVEYTSLCSREYVRLSTCLHLNEIHSVYIHESATTDVPLAKRRVLFRHTFATVSPLLHVTSAMQLRDKRINE